jgi:hypothetical protein
VEELTRAQAQADFDVLRMALEEAHGGLYRFSTKRELDGRFDAYRARLTRPLTKLAFIAFISELLADTRDGHMRLEYDEGTTAALGQARLFPFRVMIEGSRIVVLFNDTPANSTIRPGMEILRINSRTVPEVLAAILPRLPGDASSRRGSERGSGATSRGITGCSSTSLPISP